MMTRADSMNDRRLMLVLSAACLAAFATSLLIGPSGFGLPRGDTRLLILREIRLPRALMGALVGAALGLAGAVLQGYLRNPLAEPGIIGVSGGAALGAVIAIHLGLAASFPLGLPLAGLIGAGLAALAVVGLAGERSTPVTLILAGVAVSSLTAALISLTLNLSRNPFAAAEAIFWMMGSLADRSLVHVYLAAPLIIGGIVLLLRAGTALDALTLGEDAAHTLGIDLDRLRLIVVAGVALAVGAATAVTGMIGFVGLVVPHVLRRYVAQSPSRLLKASALGGALMVLLADCLLRLISPVVDLRIGVLTALLGAPFFLWLVIKLRAEYAP
jgi:iron complex transport system permease protein